MEKVMEDERKCQEKYERELREAEEQRRLQRESEARKSTSKDITTQEGNKRFHFYYNDAN